MRIRCIMWLVIVALTFYDFKIALIAKLSYIAQLLSVLRQFLQLFYDHKQVFLIPQTQRQTQSLANPGFGQLWRWLESLIPKQDQRVKFSQGRVEWLGVRITIFTNICSKDILSQSHYITSLWSPVYVLHQILSPPTVTLKLEGGGQSRSITYSETNSNVFRMIVTYSQSATTPPSCIYIYLYIIVYICIYLYIL